MESLPEPLYTTRYGAAYVGDALELLQGLPDESIDLVLTSPPFALQRQKEYGNVDQDEYVDWLLSFAIEIKRVLKSSGSFVLDLGGAYRRGRPVRSLYNYRVLIRMCDDLGWNLAEEFFWFNPSKLPSPIEWVNKRKIRAKDAVNTIWWFSKTDFPKADITKVLLPYSERMKLLLQNSDKYYSPKKRPSGHDISSRFAEDKGGAIPPNLLQIPNTESNSRYLRCCQIVGINGHPARFPEKLPEFFIHFLTDVGDTVLDIFAGSNTTGAVAEALGRRWIAFEIDRSYLATSAFRFLNGAEEDAVRDLYSELITEGTKGIIIPQGTMQQYLLEETGEYETS
ncbi:site-specific DNA-methyltransferase [Chloroflexus sp. MS-CIW-1]|jgi:site-specific DNA-methyltransferase (cytosine-N4-specific)|uniref:DNA-methyltransferase n=1 Tax=Chloroflexus sp. MS-CIW-1 TaxID=3055768 RepID=UPI001B171405|nr:site-specific DNA-methyltransferase [Chloroflexus sp. MS-CIW-1]MBO9312020.1 site-specific DNA-methyltransferase [Chloroflexus sp.]MBO9347359.1 site-specific DNA-methyltransferase [Chloroflexus sp.]MBO9372647.1 site-specific DNA-methyltransferase [Chloroflexus sp.]MDN5270648.1 site-specific DNA-methyltransferase [Chloroflexus sp. MS-CIW-1]